MEIVVLSILILINGFFALSEIALVSSKKSRLEKKARDGSKGAKFALKLLGDSEGFLSAIQVGITLIGIVTGVYGGMNIADDIKPFFANFDIISNYAHEIALSLTIVLITFLSIVIGELVPKTIALSNPEQVSIRVAPLVYYFSKSFYPFVKILAISTNFINGLLGIKKYNENITEAEIIQLIKSASNDGIIEKEQNIIHERIFYFADKRARHIMTRREDVEWINLDKPLNENKEKLLKTQHSKVICSKSTLDNFVGIINVNAFLKLINNNSDIELEKLIIQPLIIPENLEAHKILTLMRQNKTHICCVISEFGGFEGLITIHDIIENIIGQIPEEGEEYEPDLLVSEKDTYLVNGDAPVEILKEIITNFSVNYDEIEYSTVAGFIVNNLRKIPKIGDKLFYEGFRFEIVDMDYHRIDKIQIKKL